MGKAVNLYPVIPAIRTEKDIEEALASPSTLVFLLTGNVANIEEVVYNLKKGNKEVFVHIDLVKGLSFDKCSLEFLKDVVGADGIISTHISLLKAARKLGLKIIQRVFLVDSGAMESGIVQAKDLEPDFLEILPGIIPEVIEEISSRYPGNIIAGGLVRKKEQIFAALKAGAKAISTSCKDLWKIL
ncbi:glycerol-3-phosphate responsive antiterminator [Thermotoga neapolitana]|uniref:glycerol-3-phosphate responsive antiterminator n=1 Tax=Thermotoga neapolitana TaxID=2337 RepID=UPI000308F66B|nr:glycerol-3-phosphate responsive antiterminator [Thermotoga neapolitana]KFZ21740.1 Glycerol uptake operon antiterminator [Thermotoga neapolitana LA10]